ncbi:adenosine deaminase [Turneriella parva]|uniref:adenosine deaminase n=1 Tax=Turneriella parva (strain ATCC BAA-1111 / DSM 21527 / NCTC 11395 / H) TaxID=869212 RepID=I4B2B2_TURPD|nr:adenosine deaminase [Turneriella parva]AFM11419.1 Adenosine deaminase [Turneriella parva DSM 21527]
MIDLHHHFDGAFETETLYKEAKRRNLAQGKLSAEEFAARCQVPQDCNTLTDFLAVFNFFYDIAQDLNFLRDQAQKLPARMAAGGVLYLETRFGPHLFTGDAYSAEQVTQAVVEGIAAGKGAPVRVILCALRNAPIQHVQELVDLYQKFHAHGVCGIDLAGDESKYACREYAPVFDRAHQLGIPITIHAGEAAGPQSVYDAIDLFHARRIGHGIRSIEDERLMRRLADEKIGLEVCLTSNLQTGNAASYAAHPFMKLRAAGLKVTLNTDDPSVSGIDLNHEWAVALREYNLSVADQRELLLNSIDQAFCDATLKATLREQVAARLS